MRAEAETVLREVVAPAYERLLTFMRTEYLPKARTTLAATAMPDGEAYYQAMIEKFTTLNLTPKQIHEIGLKEVARIEKEMEATKQRAKFTGTMAEFFQFLRTDPQFYAKTPRELLSYSAYVSKKADWKLGETIGFLPRRRHGIRPVPDALAPIYTGGRGGLDACLMNTYNLPARPLYTLAALTLHECTPGHSFQAALALEGPERPPFRRGTSFSAYGEGWGLYTEWLGTVMGIYETPYEDFGRLTYEMWRACRLVIDTGIHAFGWSREQAMDYLRTRAALSEHEITTEVERYIAWPGQALAYKLGELQIRRHRREAEEKLGSKFDQRTLPRCHSGARLGSVAGAGAADGAVLRRRGRERGDSGWWLSSELNYLPFTVVLPFLLLCSLTAAPEAQEAEWRTKIREALLNLPDPLPPLAPRSHGRFEPAPGVTAERVTYGTQFGMRVPAILYLPRPLPSSKIPAFIIVNGHGGDKYSWYAFYSGILYARAGAAVLTYDPTGEGERNGERKSGTREHDDVEPPEELARRLGRVDGDRCHAGRLVSRSASRGRSQAHRGCGLLNGIVHPRARGRGRYTVARNVLVGGGNLDGPNGYWDNSKAMCQGTPYRSLQPLGDRPAVIYALHAARGSDADLQRPRRRNGSHPEECARLFRRPSTADGQDARRFGQDLRCWIRAGRGAPPVFRHATGCLHGWSVSSIFPTGARQISRRCP